MSDKPRVLVSACLMGVQCRYDGKAQPMDRLAEILSALHPIPVCPEQLGGLCTPRVPAERRGTRVVNRDGADVTDAFERGAAQVCALASLCGARCALLKARSPSCGCGEIYDGSFTGRIIPGSGVAAQALERMGVPVFTEAQLAQLIDYLEGNKP
ncbi:MAG: DUF523 domain-containing protein [Clostridia bacterium]|nr:DUF523 domain-containing protein [Clostridia bacterium]